MKTNIVETKSGKIRGYEREGRIDYLGIPFAKPPVGNLRFKRAQGVETWNDVFDAKEYGNVAPQIKGDGIMGREDCLTLNIQSPLEADHLPVFVWIHGGVYSMGYASEPLVNGRHFVAEGIVYVSIQYRLNVLGFYDFTTYSGCQNFESNCGVSDQILAMKWIHENIAAFGGNPDQVTIVGESAGACSVLNLMAAPDAKGTFQQAIVESALPNSIYTHEMARKNMDLFIDKMGWKEEDLQKLSTIDPYELQEVSMCMPMEQQKLNPGLCVPGPVIDALIPKRPIDAIRNGSARGIKLIIGTNHDEGSFVGPGDMTSFLNKWSMVAEMFEKNGCDDAIPDVIKYYSQVANPFEEFVKDYEFLMPSLKAAEAQSKYGDVWMYRYDFVSKSAEKSGAKAAHTFEIPCVFGNIDNKLSQDLFEGEEEETIRKMIQSMQVPWINFVKYGHPDVQNWPKFSGYDSLIRIFDRETRTVRVDERQLMELWGDMRFYEN